MFRRKEKCNVGLTAVFVRVVAERQHNLELPQSLFDFSDFGFIFPATIKVQHSDATVFFFFTASLIRVT